MDNITSIQQADLAKYMGLTKDKNGADAATGTAVCDASASKYMEVGTGNVINYAYRRGGVVLIAEIDVGSQKITWKQDGLGANDQNRIDALAQGLKLAQSSDLTTGTSPF